MDRSTKQKISKETQTFNVTMAELDLIDIYRTFHPKTMNFTFFSSAHGTFSKIHHILGHKSSFGKFKKIEIISSIFSDHSEVRLDVNDRKKKNFNFFSSARGTFSRIDNFLGHKSSLSKFFKNEIIPSIFSDHNALRLDVNYRRKTIKNSNIWSLNNMLLNNQ